MIAVLAFIALLAWFVNHYRRRQPRPWMTARYRVYMQSPAWDNTRRLALFRGKFHCARCGSRSRLDVHHKTYARLGNEAPDDLMVLCRSCHCAHHGRNF